MRAGGGIRLKSSSTESVAGNGTEGAGAAYWAQKDVEKMLKEEGKNDEKKS